MEEDLRHTCTIAPRSVETFVLRVPNPPVPTPFGLNRGRETVLVRVTDAEGETGWGEAWCNYPSGIGAEHRARLIGAVLVPLLQTAESFTPAAAFERMTTSTRLLGVQSGEPGPLAQAIAGVDIALWDLAARRAGVPLWRLLGGTRGQVPIYASGLAPAHAEELYPALRATGWRALKVRIWGGDKNHAETLGRLRDLVGADFGLMADANQSWSSDQALRQLQSFSGLDLGWIEEPIPADAPEADWKHLHEISPVPISGGENLRGDGFDWALKGNFLDVVQPDMCKWGGFSGCLPLARRIMRAGKRYCPHYLGGGVGLIASAHLLAAAGGDGLLEYDQQDNPLRNDLITVPPVANGEMVLPGEPGLGVVPKLEAVREYRIT